MLLTTEQQGEMVFHILEHNYHRPFTDGKCNRENIEDQIVIGLYSNEIPPCDEEDVDMICDMVDDLIQMYGTTR